jgi:hypothetical protein
VFHILCFFFVFEAVTLQSPTSQWRSQRNKNGVEQHISSDSGNCEYLELQDSPTGDGTLQDYINVPGLLSVGASTAQTATCAKSEEGSSQTKCGTVGTASPTPSDSSELPEYVNVEISSYELSVPPPPIPPRNK